MKKTLFALVVLSSLFISWACNSTAVPYGPVGSSGTNPRGNGATSTPTQTFQPTPAYISGWTADGTNGLAEGNGYVYVAEANSAVTQVQIFSNPGGGVAVASWTGYGSNPFWWPAGVTVNSTTGNVYVLDLGTCVGSDCTSTNGSAVYEFTSSTTPTTVTSWTGYNGTPFYAPSGLAMDTSGDLYVADQGNYQVEEFGSAGTTMGAWNANNNQYFLPEAVAVDGSNNIYVLDAGNSYVWEVSTINGTGSYWPLAYASNENAPDYGLAVDSSGNVYVADYYYSLVEVYSNSGNLIGEMTGSGGTAFTGPDALLLYGGDIYVGDYDNDNVQVFGPNSY